MHNGHKNWDHWNVSLWLFHDEGLYRMVQRRLRSSDNLDTITRRILADLPNATPDGAPYKYTSVRAALRGVR